MRFHSRQEQIMYITRQVSAEAEKQNREILIKTLNDFMPIVKRRIQDLFNQTVTEFYDSYTPRGIHPYERRRSLYNLIDISIHGSGENMSLEGDFDEGKILFRNARETSGDGAENGLYDQVFRHGWHGGAPRGDGHPSPSDDNDNATPYWRKTYPAYRHWHTQAAVASIPPLDRFYELLHEYENSDANKDYLECYRRNYHPIDLSMVNFYKEVR